MEHWSAEWPQEPGFYWGFGRYRDEKYPRLETVQVRRVSNSTMYISHGAFLYSTEWVGMFLPLSVPAMVPAPGEIDAIESKVRVGR